MKDRVIKRLFIILTIIYVLFMWNNQCQASGDLDVDFNYIEAEDMTLPFGAEKAIAGVIRLLRDTSIIISVVVLTIIGLKFMLGSVEEKAHYKETLGPWVIGVVIIGLSCSTVPTLIYNIVSEESGMEITASQVQVTLNHSRVTLSIGENEEVSLVATVLSNDEIDDTVTWTSSDNTVATVDSTGKVKALAMGTATIKATAGGAEASCKVTVESSRTMSITISESSITIDAPMELTHTLRATITPSTSREPIYWSTSNSSVATVRNGVVRAKGAGTATITAKSGSKSATCTVQVNSSREYYSSYYNPSTDSVSPTRTSDMDLGFWIYIPDVLQIGDVDKLPCIVFLHGSGECGTNLNVLKNRVPFRLQERDYPAVVIYPQTPTSGWNATASRVIGLIDYAIDNYNVDANKVALTGFSLGGSGTWSIGLQYPTKFSCLVPVCGYSSQEASTYPDCPVWVIGSTGDGSASYMTRINTLLTNAGKNVKINIYSDDHITMHTKGYSTEVINWMLEQERD